MKLRTAKPREYLAYAVNYIWQNAVTNLAELRRINSGDRTGSDDWTNLLKAIDLS